MLILHASFIIYTAYLNYILWYGPVQSW